MNVRPSSQHLLSAMVALCVTVSASHSTAHEHENAHADAYEVLKKDVGLWETETSIWTAPDAEPLVSRGKEKSYMLGKFWLIYEFEGSMGGQSFSGFGNLGYDAKRKKYVGTWVESTGPNLGLHEGTWDEATKSFTMYSVARDPSAQPEKAHKMISTYQDNDHRTFVLFEQVQGETDKWRKMMEIKYTRKKNDAE